MDRTATPARREDEVEGETVRPRRQALALACSGLLAPALPARAAVEAAAPLLAGLDSHRFEVESADPRLRRWFAQGLLLAHGFNGAEAVRAFEAALALDPRCASAWWALAWALGPTINADMDAGAAARVSEALTKARRHAGRAPAVRQAAIQALSLRHPTPDVLDEEAYAAAMDRQVRRHPASAELAFLAAEARLNLHPYDWWLPGGGAQPWTAGIEALLARALRLDPRHPGAHHYWIHLQEASPHPHKALPSADYLAHAVPGSGHLLHMPSHIYMRVGRYDDAILANQRATAADARYLARVDAGTDAQSAYRVGYVAHNQHFLWAAAAMAGRRQLALQAADAARPVACGPGGRDPGSAIVQHYAVLPFFTRLRFGLWQALLHDTPPPDGSAPYPLAMWRYARGAALARGGQIEPARREFEGLQAVAADPALAALKIKNLNPAAQLLRIASLSLAAEIAHARSDQHAAVRALQQATEVEDGLTYDEPHLWLAPTRHALADALLAAGRPAEAERACREDLARYPANGWALGGLAQALAAQGRQAEARRAEAAAGAAFHAAEQRPAGARF
ncbi:hypothetical protein [Rubrivivax sp. A210]|uniref:hypothetical protein n=1 Tax=Rubrivivax sp. A210 TaxID=2772301 RepID=UPI00191B11B9|nr:hypothetical protein [Rubrivivax sp. A210]